MAEKKEVKHNTIDGKEVWTRPHATKPYYETNQADTPMVKITVESKYGADKEVTAFVGGNYVTKGMVKRFEAKFLLNEAIEIPETLIPILKDAKVARKVRSQDGQSSKIKYMQRYLVHKAE